LAFSHCFLFYVLFYPRIHNLRITWPLSWIYPAFWNHSLRISFGLSELLFSNLPVSWFSFGPIALATFSLATSEPSFLLAYASKFSTLRSLHIHCSPRSFELSPFRMIPALELSAFLSLCTLHRHLCILRPPLIPCSSSSFNLHIYTAHSSPARYSYFKIKPPSSDPR
jgi:hypothetical protein